MKKKTVHSKTKVKSPVQLPKQISVSETPSVPEQQPQQPQPPIQQPQPVNVNEILQDGVSAMHVLRSQIKPLAQVISIGVQAVGECDRLVQENAKLSARIAELEKQITSGPIQDSVKKA